MSNDLEAPPVQSSTDNVKLEKSNSSDELAASSATNDISKWEKVVSKIEEEVSSFLVMHTKTIKFILIAVLLICAHTLLVFAAIHNFEGAKKPIIFASILWALGIMHFVYSPFLHDKCTFFLSKPLSTIATFLETPIAGRLIACAVLLVIIALLLVDTWGEKRRLTGLAGMAFLVASLYALSNNKKAIRWRTVCSGYVLQLVFACIILRWDTGSKIFQWGADTIVSFLNFSNYGLKFVYGFLAKPPNICGMDPVFAFTALQVIIFFGGVVGILYYYGITQYVLKHMATVTSLIMGTTAVESLNACATTLLGMSEAPMLVRPYLIKLTDSELFAVMASGFSTIAGSLFTAYISFGACPQYLLSAAFLSAPCSLACSKLIYPETEISQTEKVKDLELKKSEERSALEALSSGAVAAVPLVFAIIANLIVFVALLEFMNNCIEYTGNLVGYNNWSAQAIFGYAFFPLAFLLGVTENVEETYRVAQLMGTKTAVNEFIAYQELSKMVADDSLSPRSVVIATYALCSFGNFISVGIQIAILGQMAPERKSFISQASVRALLSGIVCTFYTAALAGVIISEPNVCKPIASAVDCFDPSKYNFSQLVPASITTPPI